MIRKEAMTSLEAQEDGIFNGTHSKKSLSNPKKQKKNRAKYDRASSSSLLKKEAEKKFENV